MVDVSYLAAESASVLGVLCDFHLLNLLTQRSTITSAVLSGDSDYEIATNDLICVAEKRYVDASSQ